MKGKFSDKIVWERAKEYVKKYHPIIIGIAGGYDKTLTREAIELAVSASGRAVRSIDTDTSSPRALAAAILGTSHPEKKIPWYRLLIGSKLKEIAESEPEVIIVEVAVSEPGDIDRVASELPFNMAVMLPVASTHLDLFLDKQTVAHELLSLPVSVAKEGTVILSADDPLVAGMAEHLTGKKVVTFGLTNPAQLHINRVDRTGLQGFAGEVTVGDKHYPFSIPHIVGRHQLVSVLAALSVAQTLGLDVAATLQALRKLTLPAGHMRILVGREQSTLIDDSHDASYESMITSLKTLGGLPDALPHGEDGTKRRIAILGDIADLGPHSPTVYVAIGQAVEGNADMFVAVGEGMKQVQAEVLKNGRIDTHHFVSSRDVGKWLGTYLRPNDIVLIKGDKDMRMEETVKGLLQDPDKDNHQLIHRS